MDFRVGDIFVNKNKGTIAVITKIDGDAYDFKFSNPNIGISPWAETKDKGVEEIRNAVREGYVVLYRPVTESFLDDGLFEVD